MMALGQGKHAYDRLNGVVSKGRRAGELLKEQDKNKGTRGQLRGNPNLGSSIVTPPSEAPTLEDIGIIKSQSSRYLQIRTVAGGCGVRSSYGLFESHTEQPRKLFLGAKKRTPLYRYRYLLLKGLHGY